MIREEDLEIAIKVVIVGNGGESATCVFFDKIANKTKKIRCR